MKFTKSEKNLISPLIFHAIDNTRITIFVCINHDPTLKHTLTLISSFKNDMGVQDLYGDCQKNLHACVWWCYT